MMTLSKLFRHVCIVVGAVALSTAPAAGAEPDPEGALRSLLSIPLDTAGDALGAGGLVGAAVIAIDADVVALVDDNGLTRSFLRGFASTPLRHTAGALSEFATAAVSGLHTPDADRCSESTPTDLRPGHGESHLGTVGRAFGAIGLIAVDSFANAGRLVTHAVGANSAAERLARAQTELRKGWVRPAAASGSNRQARTGSSESRCSGDIPS